MTYSWTINNTILVGLLVVQLILVGLSMIRLGLSIIRLIQAALSGNLAVEALFYLSNLIFFVSFFLFAQN